MIRKDRQADKTEENFASSLFSMTQRPDKQSDSAAWGCKEEWGVKQKGKAEQRESKKENWAKRL